MFHPMGLLCVARVEAVTHDPVARAVAERLGSAALVRWSSAWWKQREWLDVLGCALRFTNEPRSLIAAAGDQDLLFATIRRPWTLAFSPLSTRYHDFLANNYYAVSPFEVAGLGRIEWRIRPEPQLLHGSRSQKLRDAVLGGNAALTLEWSPYRPPWRAFDDRTFQPLARITLSELLEDDPQRLRFDPFRAGRGVQPVGFIHGLRRASYAASQLARPSFKDA
jgi:hypothetical protein